MACHDYDWPSLFLINSRLGLHKLISAFCVVSKICFCVEGNVLAKRKIISTYPKLINKSRQHNGVKAILSIQIEISPPIKIVAERYQNRYERDVIKKIGNRINI